MFWWLTKKGWIQQLYKQQVQKRLHEIYTGKFGSIDLGLLLAKGTGLSEKGEIMESWFQRNHRRLTRVQYGYKPFQATGLIEDDRMLSTILE